MPGFPHDLEIPLAPENPDERPSFRSSHVPAPIKKANEALVNRNPHPECEDEERFLALAKLSPAGPGRPANSISRPGREARDFCDAILNSEAYRLSIYRRICAGTLESNIEQMLWHYRFGKPKERMEIEMPQVARVLEQLSTDALIKKTRLLEERALEIQAIEAELLSEPIKKPEPTTDTSLPQASEKADPEDSSNAA